MKGSSDKYPLITVISNNKTQIRYNILEVTKQDMNGASTISFDFDYVEIAGELTRDKVIIAIIANGENEELAKTIATNNGFPFGSFQVNDFLFGLMGAFTPLMDYSNILIFYPMIADFARAENFEGMNMFLHGLIDGSVMTEEQFNLINGVLLQQNIDLNNL